MFVLGAARVEVPAADLQPPCFSHIFLPGAGTTGARKSQLNKGAHVYRNDPHNGATQRGSFCSSQERANSNSCLINSVCEGLQTATAATAPAKQSTSGCKSSEPDSAACGGGTHILQSAEVLNAAAFILSQSQNKQAKTAVCSGHSWLDPVAAGGGGVTETKACLISSWNVNMETISDDETRRDERGNISLSLSSRVSR